MTKVSLAVISLLLIAISFAGLGFFFRTALQPYQPTNTVRAPIEVTKGQTPLAVSRQLEAMQVIRSGKIFYYYGKLRGSWSRIKAGEYELSPSMSPNQIFAILESGISVAHPFLVREGENLFEIAEDIQAKGFGTKERFVQLANDPVFIRSLSLVPAPKSLEGYLFPDTYMLQRKMTQEDILRLMIRRFQSAWGPNEDQRARELNMTRDQIITLASIVEKETGAPEERPIIAGVFHNRLAKKMRLQSDPTIIYGIWKRYKGKLSRADIVEGNAYNTYTIPGLPIGPISNPGSAAIQATLNPASHNFLYFVSRNDGTHVFTPTYEDHARAVKEFQLNPKAREGKSWRDLNKNRVAPAASALPTAR